MECPSKPTRDGADHGLECFLKERGLVFHEVNIEEDLDAKEIILRVNHGRRRIPTLNVGERHFACSPFSVHKLAAGLNIPVNK